MEDDHLDAALAAAARDGFDADETDYDPEPGYPRPMRDRGWAERRRPVGIVLSAEQNIGTVLDHPPRNSSLGPERTTPDFTASTPSIFRHLATQARIDRVPPESHHAAGDGVAGEAPFEPVGIRTLAYEPPRAVDHPRDIPIRVYER